MAPGMMRILRWVASLGLAAALLGWFLWRSDLPQALGAMRDASVPLLLASMALQVLHMALRALRWRLLLAPVKRGIAFSPLFSTTVIGYLASTIFPFRVGELVRPLLLAKSERMSRSASVATVGAERVLDTLTVGGFLAVYLLLFSGDLAAGARSSALYTQVLAGGRFLGGALLLAIPLLFVVARYGESAFGWLDGRLRPREGGLGARLLGVGRGLCRGLSGVAEPRRAVAVLVASVIVWLVIGASIWCGVQAMRSGVAFPFQATFLLVPLLAVGVATPTPGGAGGYHIICALALEQIFGATRPAADASAIVLWFLSILPLVMLGFFHLWRAGIRVGDLGRMAESSRLSEGAAPAGRTGGGDPE
jgi:uncharacterized membrane protein YbhN (UPF0104 family)